MRSAASMLLGVGLAFAAVAGCDVVSGSGALATAVGCCSCAAATVFGAFLVSWVAAKTAEASERAHRAARIRRVFITDSHLARRAGRSDRSRPSSRHLRCLEN